MLQLLFPFVFFSIHFIQVFIRVEFWLSSVAFMGHVLSKEGIMVDPKKIEAVRDGSGLLQLLRFGISWALQVIIDGLLRVSHPLHLH